MVEKVWNQADNMRVIGQDRFSMESVLTTYYPSIGALALYTSYQFRNLHGAKSHVFTEPVLFQHFQLFSIVVLSILIVLFEFLIVDDGDLSEEIPAEVHDLSGEVEADSL